MHILIAEDDRSVRMLLTTVLEDHGHEVIETSNGRDAWEILKSQEGPSLAILDWIMPQMDGLEVISRLRSLDSKRPVYLILLTAKTKKSELIAGLEAGADDYLSKPFDVGELQARVKVGCRMIEMQNALIKSKEELEYQASHDPLTGLLNRRAVMDYLNKELIRCGRHNDSLAVAMCDIDHFKQVNDKYGHQTGDDALICFSKYLTENLRRYDTIGRMGGEEFLIITPLKEGTDYRELYNRLCANISETPFSTRSGDLKITVSMGVVATSAELSLDTLLGKSDDALYQAKAEGRNRVCYA